MSTLRPVTAAKSQALAPVLALREAHARQRELVRASLVACPAVKSPTHRRAA